MVIRVLDGGALPASVVSDWSERQRSEPTLASPFFRPEFTQLVAACRAGVRVAVLDDIGLFPFQRGRLGVGYPVGSRLSDHHGLVAAPSADADAGELLRGTGLSAWEFDGALAVQRAFAPYRARLRQSPTLELGEGWDAYARSRAADGSSILAESARKARRLEKRLGPLRFEARVADAQTLELLLAWKSAQYARTGAVDIFRFAWVRDVVRRAHAIDAPAFAGVLSALYAGTTPVALHFGLRSASVWHWWLPAYDPAHARDSPGTILLERMARAAPELGLATIDLGKGDARYKSRFANGAVELATGVATRPSLGAAWLVGERRLNGLLRRVSAGGVASRGATRRRLR
jgi:CelD/BcsL family acetyltransferase involved in cellulose biosynthesis